MNTCPTCRRLFVDTQLKCPLDDARLEPTSGHPTVPPRLGQSLGSYRLIGLLGEGGMGSIYVGAHTRLNRYVAIKLLRPELQHRKDHIARFFEEARTVNRIKHPNIVEVIDLVEDVVAGAYLVLELLRGPDLKSRLRNGELPIDSSIQIGAQIADALSAVHELGIVHRDLKPDNVMLVRPKVGYERAVLIDFGIALPVDHADATRLTHGGGLVGTPHYMAPEQVNGDDIDGRADVYGLGATLYRMLTGRVPFDGTGVEVVVAHLARAVEPVRALAPLVTAELEAIVMRCLAKRVSDRYDTAADLARALAELDSGGARSARARRVSSAPALAPGSRRQVAAVTDLVAATPRPLGTARLIGGLVALAVVGAAIAFAVAYQGTSDAAAQGPATVDTPGRASDPAPEPGPKPAATRVLIVDDGGLSMRVVVPESIPVGAPVRFALEIWDGDGAPVTAAEVVVTVESESGDARGFAATRAGLGRSVFAFTTRFATPGRYKLRVFPPIGDATFVVDIDVI